MSVEYSNPRELAEPLGAYSHVASATGRIVGIAGQVGSQSDGSVDADCRSQVVQTFENLRLALESQGLAPTDLLQITTYLVDAGDIPAFFEARAGAFEKLFP